MANARMTVDALREQVARIEAEVGTQVSRLDAKIGTATEANSPLSTQIADAILLLDSQRESMETREKAVEERMGSFHDRMQAMTEEFEERIRSLEGENRVAEVSSGAGHASYCRSASCKGAST